MSVLDDLVKSIKEKPVRSYTQSSTQTPTQRPPQRGIVKSGAGGTIFDFGNCSGNPLIDRYNQELNHHADTTQLEIARAQQMDFQKSLGDFVEKGKDRFEAEKMLAQSSDGVHGDWTKQLSKSTDEQIVEAFKKGELDCNENQQGPAGGGMSGPNRFAKSSIKIGGEDVKATSETDAALIEMMKGGHFDDEKEQQ